MAHPDFELRRGVSFNLLAQLAFLPSVISFFTQNKEGQAPHTTPLDLPPSTYTGLEVNRHTVEPVLVNQTTT